jgi:hypothetical protein
MNIEAGLAVFAIVLAIYGGIGLRLSRWSITMPMVFVISGVVCAPLEDGAGRRAGIGGSAASAGAARCFVECAHECAHECARTRARSCVWRTGAP